MFREDSLKILEKKEVPESFPQNLDPGVKYFWYKKEEEFGRRFVNCGSMVCKLGVIKHLLAY